MFNDISVLLKHKVFMGNERTKKRGKNNILYLLLFCGGFLFLISKNMISIYNSLSGLTFENGNFGDIYMNFIVTFFSLFFILSFSSMMSFNLKRNEEIDFLLTLPIKRSSIVSYNLIISSISMLMYLVLYLAPVIAFFMNKTPLFISIGVGGVVLSVTMLILISALFAVMLSKVASQKMLRIVMIIVNLFYAGAYILMFQTLPNNISNVGELPEILMKADGFIRSDFNIFSMGINSGDKPLYLLILALLAIVAGALYFYTANRLNFTKTKVKTSKINIKKSGEKTNALLKKEMIIYRRNEQLIYYIFYPVGFGLFMGFINKDFMTALFIISLMGSMFISMQTAFSMSVEGSSIGLTKMLPINLEQFIRIKLLVPITINFVLLLIVFVIFNLFMDVNPLTLILLPLILVVQILSSLSGVSFTLKKPPQKMNNPNAFMRSSSFLGQFLMMIVLSMVTILPISIFLFQTAGTATSLINALLISASCAGLIISIFLNVRMWNTIKMKILVW